MVDDMDRHQVRFALLKIFLVVLAGTSWLFSSFIMNTRPEESEDALSSLVRLPASLPAQIPGISVIPGIEQNLPGLVAPQVKTMPPIEMNVVKVACWDNSRDSHNKTSARWIRLTGKACQTTSPLEGVSVRNVTNGYVATVFPTAMRGMTTDFIPLQSGRNEIRIRFDQGDGATLESQVSFLREQ